MRVTVMSSVGSLGRTCLVLLGSQIVNALEPYTGPVPSLSHSPFGYGSLATGGSTNTSSVYVVSDAPSLREAVALPFPKTIYVNGTINGNELDNGTLATCQDYIDLTGSDGADIRQYNFTLYLLSLNSTYTDLVNEAAEANTTFEDHGNATEYRALLASQNGWRPVVSNTQKATVGISLTNDTSLIGWDGEAALNGVNLYLSSINNVWIRNLRLVSPADCFPAPETYPSSWNGKFDAVGVVTSTNIFLDSCTLQDSLDGSYVQPDILPPGWEVDRFDGLFDAEDGSDNITISHNIVRNHHKSMLLGGGTKEADRDLGKMHFTIFGNQFDGSASRNPLMRFGTFDILANVFGSVNDQEPRFTSNNESSIGRRDDEVPADAVFQYHLGVYNQSTVQVKDNVFLQTGSVPGDTSRIFTISEATLPDLPARVCIPESSVPMTLNGEEINVEAIARETIDYFVEEKETAIEGAVLVTCEGVQVDWYDVPQTFSSAEEVQEYVLNEAGQK